MPSNILNELANESRIITRRIISTQIKVMSKFIEAMEIIMDTVTSFVGKRQKRKEKTLG